MNLTKTFFAFLVLMLIGDGILISVHVLNKLDIVNNTKLLLTTDGGYGEMYQYFKEGMIAGIFLFAALKTRSLMFFAWGALFIFLLIDDAGQLHETTGEILATSFEFKSVFNMQPRDVAQPLAVALLVSPLFTLLAFAYFHATAKEKKVSHWMILLVAGVGFFGVIVDVIHAAIPWGFGIVALIEESGEMTVMSAILAFVYHTHFKNSEYATAAHPEYT
ncbi:hypothetical protein [Alteromonas sp. ASW11-130]|uniref:hypothetical protein n=1 Tax=Alteromonas sp. ASW11-130 TaxID=3015775 RepID=UPI0022419B65|nr:hypothetical protein [Alteromonas sp. ASW11-130]MCW8091218.1 hypothetical protein [Alteromonas sp. ASW11-130]